MKNFLQNKNNKGFTLVELMVSVSVFVVIMTISMGSIFSIFDANRKSQSLRTVMDNLNFTMEAMTRTIRFGTAYHCDITQSPVTTERNCLDGASSIAVKASDLSTVSYYLEDGQIWRTNSSIDGGVAYKVTSDDVTIEELAFRVTGAVRYNSVEPIPLCSAGGQDCYQPMVIITIKGYAGSKPTTRSSFSLQTTVSQRMFDSQ